MRKKGWVLLIFIALLWWWHIYRTAADKRINLLSERTRQPAPDLKTIKEKENVLREKLIRKAEQAFYDENSRKPRNLEELIAEGFLSRESIAK